MTNIIKELRENNEMTKTALAQKLGINIKTLYSYENGITPIPDFVLCQLSKIFSCTIDYILGQDEDTIKANQQNEIKMMREKNNQMKKVLDTIIEVINQENK